MDEETLIKDLLTCFTALTSSTGISSESLSRFKARARDMPTHIFSKGLVYMLVLCAAKGDLDTFQKALARENCSDIVNALSSLDKDKEKFGYTAYMSLLVYLLKKQGMLTGNTFKEVVEEVLDNPLIEREAYMVAEWLKRFSEAYID